MITTGVRWAESASRRTKRGIYESMPHDLSKKVIINNDNADTRLLFESCKLQAKRVCNPIVDWSDYDVWSYIHAERIPINPLYSCGFHRVGCVGCPMAGRRMRLFEFGRYPTYQRATSVPLSECSKNVLHAASSTAHGVLGQLARIYSAGGCRTGISRDK